MNRVEDFILRANESYGFSSGIGIANKYLDVSLVSDNGLIEIPDVWISEFSNLILQEYTSFCIALATRRPMTSRRLVRGAFSDFMLSPRYHKICGVHMTCGATYYGLPGIIFNSDFDPILMMTYTIKDLGSVVEEIGNNRFELLRHNCRISPKVFDHANNIIEKTIIKKILPFCASHRETISRIPYDSYTSPTKIEGTLTRVIIDDINERFIRVVTPPKVSDDREEKIHDVLAHNQCNI